MANLAPFDPSAYVSAPEAARLLGVAARTVIRHCQRGSLEGAYQVFGEGTSWRIPLHSVAALMPDPSDVSHVTKK